MPTGFRELYFGKASAEAEVSEDADRFLDTYYDRWNIKDVVRNKSAFLVVGPKGSGKSAVGAFIDQSLKRKHGEHSVFNAQVNFDEVAPNISTLANISSKIVSEGSSGVTDSAWRLFLSVQLLTLLMRDESSELNRDPAVLQFVKELQSAGLMVADFPSVLRKVRESRLSISVKGLLSGERSTSEVDAISVGQLGDWIANLVFGSRSANSFTLTIDGLDRIISENEAYWLSLAALLRVGYDFHNRLKAASSDIRIFIMCRSDVFRKIQFADADKIVSDALFIDWGTYQTQATDSPLWDYLALKAGITPEKLFTFFPESVLVGQRRGPGNLITTPSYLIHATRSTPREMTMLMRKIQAQVPTTGSPTSERIRNGVDEFASRDLLTIVLAEATGILGAVVRKSFEEIISGLPSAKDVRLQDFRDAALRVGVEVGVVADLCEFMFMAGLLGNYNPDNGYVQFYHRRDTYAFKRQGPWQLHVALMYAFNVPYTANRI